MPKQVTVQLANETLNVQWPVLRLVLRPQLPKLVSALTATPQCSYGSHHQDQVPSPVRTPLNSAGKFTSPVALGKVQKGYIGVIRWLVDQNQKVCVVNYFYSFWQMTRKLSTHDHCHFGVACLTFCRVMWPWTCMLYITLSSSGKKTLVTAWLWGKLLPFESHSESFPWKQPVRNRFDWFYSTPTHDRSYNAKDTCENVI